MIRLFKRARPRPIAEPVRITPQDQAIATHWGYTPEQWSELDPWIRVAKRDGYFQAAGL